MVGLARAGRGAAAFVQDESQLEETVMKQLRLALRPRLLDSSVSWGDGVYDVGQVPQQSFSCRAGERLVVYKLFSLTKPPEKAEVEPSPKQVTEDSAIKQEGDDEPMPEEKAADAAVVDAPIEVKPSEDKPEGDAASVSMTNTDEKQPDEKPDDAASVETKGTDDSATKKKKKSAPELKSDDSVSSSKKKKSSANVKDEGEAADSATKKKKKSTPEIKASDDSVSSGKRKGSSTDVKKPADDTPKKKKTAPSLAVCTEVWYWFAELNTSLTGPWQVR